MGLFDRFTGKGKPAATATPPAPAPKTPPGSTPDAQSAPEPIGTNSEIAAQKKGFLRKMESNLRRAVDGYVDRKADALMDDATKRAEDFRQETLELVQDQAMQLLDITENRIDRKLQEIESLLEARLRAELRMRLRALIWTLAFVLLMALVSVVYIWIKRSAGLENAPTNQAAQGLVESRPQGATG